MRLKQSSTQTKRWLRRAIRAGGRQVLRAPEPVGILARRTFEAIPDRFGPKERVRRIVRGNAAPRGNSSRWDGGRAPGQASPSRFSGYLALDDAGSTYSRDELATYLQLELGYLKRELFARPLPSTVPTGSVAEHAGSAAQRVADYLDLVKTAGREPQLSSDGQPLHLVVVNQYPQIGNEYGNGFVHRRVKYYLDAGVQVHVAVVTADADPESYTYDGVPVLVSRGSEVREMLSRHDYTSISSHFLNPYIWEQLRDAMAGHRLFTFMHGFESRRWIRTIRNYRSPEPLSNGIKDTLIRQRFWREVLAHPNGPERFVFVSQWWRRGSQDDMELVYPAQRTAVIHNVTDIDLFRYRPKDPEQRFRILWVRSAANLNYAPDLAAEVLKRLRETQYWPQLEILIIGDGQHFTVFQDAFAEDLNVRVERRFASQREIALLHHEYGVFLVPTRWDSQGVSRDEAMASGLVPVTNKVCAIPEFVDDTCAVVAGPEDVEGMVQGMIWLFEHPELFSRMSNAASVRVAGQSGPEHSVWAEMQLMGMLPPASPQMATGRAEEDNTP